MSYIGDSFAANTDVAPPNDAEESFTAEDRWNQLYGDREPYLMRARRLSNLTIPSLFRFVGSNGSTETPETWQSAGAYCVNNLAGKLTLTIFPPGISPIRLDPSREVLQSLAQLGNDDNAKGQLKLQIDQALRQSELEFTNGITEDMDSVVFATGMAYKLVGGTHGYQQYSDGSWRGFPLDKFMCLRDGQGNLLEFIIRDDLVWETLPSAVRDFLFAHRPSEDDPDKTGRKRPKRNIPLFTHGQLGEDGKWKVYQEACNFKIPSTDWTYAKEFLPYLFVPFNLLPGESYGRGYCEQFESDLTGLEGAEEILTEGSAASALLVRLVKPGGVTSKEALAKARNGAVITGDEKDVHTLETNKAGDFAVLEKRVNVKETRLGRAFLLDITVQRQAERVTAEEVRTVSNALNQQLGSLYLGLVKTFQVPYSRLKMAALMRTKRMTPLPKKQVNVQMATGAAALTREAELQRLDDAITPPNPAMQQMAAQVINPANYFRRRFVKLGVDPDGIVKSDDQLQAEQQQAQQSQMAAQLGPQAIKAGSDLMGKGIDHQSNMAQIAAQQNTQQPQPQGPST